MDRRPRIDLDVSAHTPIAEAMPTLRRVLTLLALVTVLGVALFGDVGSRLYPPLACLPTAFVYGLVASTFLAASGAGSDLERRFWHTLAALGFYSAALMLGFGLAGAAIGSISVLSARGSAPDASWFLAVGASGVVSTALIFYAATLRSRAFFSEPHHPRMAALDAVSLGAAVLAIQGALAIPTTEAPGWLGALSLVQVGGWSVAVAGAAVHVAHGHMRYERSSRWILLGCVAISVGTTALVSQIMHAAARRPTGGSAWAASLILVGAACFGEAYEADRRAFADAGGDGGRVQRGLYPSLELDALEARRHETGGMAALRGLLAPSLSLVGPAAVGLTMLVFLTAQRGATVVHRTILFAGFVASLGTAVWKLSLGARAETEATARVVTRLVEEKALVDEILQAVDKDGEAVATRVHDRLLQPLTAAYLKLSHAKLMLERGEAAQATLLLEEATTAVSERIAEARSLVSTVYPPSLDHLGLTAALKELVAAYGRQGLEVTADLDWAGSLERPIAVAIYRVANEALDNASKYASPRKARLRLRSVRDVLELEVQDEGPGFTYESDAAYIEVGKLGIVTMHRVAEMVGATVEISTVGRTRVAMVIPLGQRERIGV